MEVMEDIGLVYHGTYIFESEDLGPLNFVDEVTEDMAILAQVLAYRLAEPDTQREEESDS